MRVEPLGVQNVVLFNKKVGWAGDWGFSLGYPTTIPRNMSTLKEEKFTVYIIRLRIGKRGPKKKELPDDEIKQLHEDGMGAKAIATKPKREHGIKVSYKTIQRLLSDERS